MKNRDIDVLVIGAGHAGCEAAAAASAMGLQTCLITMQLETIAQMSCNPAIGGLAKGHLVREIDALGGLMGQMADKTGIQFRLLNRSRGGAVQAPRAQCDKAMYRLAMKSLLEKIPNLTIFQGIVARIKVESGRACGIETLDGTSITAKSIIVTPGTFLNGLIHIGLESYPAGRANEPSSSHLSKCLRDLGFRMLRLKTGTPMRLDERTIAWKEFIPQPGDEIPIPFSFRTKGPLENKIVCYQGYTNYHTHDVIRKNLNKSPLYSGKIQGIGPRYCPSIEDKVVKFPHHQRHQFFLEPEGLNTTEVYVNGLSSSLPSDVQKKILASIPGLDQAKIIRPAYGIEYDSVSPEELFPSLETKKIGGLFLAGQINGTSGYEEAAAQGIMAGINAALKIHNKNPFVLRRDEAYIGVLIDDLVTKGVDEPYRLFTSRAEYRLNLRIDNADVRLMGYGRDFGLVNEEEYRHFDDKKRKAQEAMAFLKREKIKIENAEKMSLQDYLKKPGISIKNVLEYKKFPQPLNDEEMRYIESEVKYEGYLKKQEKEIWKIKKKDRVKISPDMNFNDIPGLTREAVEKLEKYRPATLGEAIRIPGLTPAAIYNLDLFIEMGKRTKAGKTRRCST